MNITKGQHRELLFQINSDGTIEELQKSLQAFYVDFKCAPQFEAFKTLEYELEIINCEDNFEVAVLSFYGVREETEEEFQNRLALDRNSRYNYFKRIEEEYNRLKKEFESGY